MGRLSLRRQVNRHSRTKLEMETEALTRQQSQVEGLRSGKPPLGASVWRAGVIQAALAKRCYGYLTG